ncbi:MAG: hypothetical protein EOO73_19190 [Myxococcales bacterium]|nr:MAG: hypothetical protein EOO73_19190 [Myxococcales bacterium]
MGNDGKAARKALRSAIESWFGRAPSPPQRAEELHARSIKTELSSTVFSGAPAEWVRYLSASEETRYASGPRVSVHLEPALGVLAFEPQGEDSRWLAELLGFGFRELAQRLSQKPHVLKVFRALVFENEANRRSELTLLLSDLVPGQGTRETRSQDGRTGAVKLVISQRLALTAREDYERARTGSSGERLGAIWALVARVMHSLAYPPAPRDLFVTKIDLHARLSYLTINVLYDEQKRGLLWPTEVGSAFAESASRASGIAVPELFERDAYFRSLGKLGFMLRHGSYSRYEEDARIVARDYLDPLYLRLSLAGAMPGVLPAMRAMKHERQGDQMWTPAPELGSYGILDEEDLAAWKTVAGRFADLGFTLVRQLGMGEFGRVYEALNDNNSAFPERVALKVDRIVGKKKKAILEAEEAIAVGRQLAASPHVIRIYDGGKLSGVRFTYHVLQLIDGDTLDNLVGVTGREHASVSRPPSARGSEMDAQLEFARAVDSRGSEMWRRQRLAAPFTQALSPAMVLDLLTSVLLWLEEVHQVGFANNDLKNGNLMMSRRGQLKGIDLDSYSKTHSPKDKMTDFMFLAVSLILLVFNAPITDRDRRVPWEELIESEERLRARLATAWPFGDVEALSQGRVSHEDLTNLVVDLVQRSRQLVYAKRPELFAQDIARLLDLKRRLLFEEFVFD